MPEVRLKQLHMATSMEMLNQKVDVQIQDTTKRLIKSAKTILSRAQSSDKERDEELAYVYFMRYFTVIKAVQQNTEYKENKKSYDSDLGSKNFSSIIQRAEELSKSLQRRYSVFKIKTEDTKEEKRKPLQEVEERKEKETRKNSLATPIKVPPSVDGFIRCEKLYSLTKEKVSSFLVVDVRPREHFSNSFMKLSSMINIPEETLKPGLTANKAGRDLNEHSRLLWERRHLVDYLILCDFATDDHPLPSPIAVLVDAMENWDPGKSYKATPLVLKGGFEIFALMYPILVNSKCDFISKMSLSSTSSASHNNGSALNKENDGLFNFEFPDLDTGFLSTPSPLSFSSSRLRAPQYPSLEDAAAPRPSINRSLKPKGAREEEESVNSLDEEPSGNPLNEGMLASSDSLELGASNPNPLGRDTPPTISSEPGGDDARWAFPRPVVPDRDLKPQELIDNLKAKQKDLDAEQVVLEQALRAEKDTLEKLQEIEDTHKTQALTQDMTTQLKLSAKESRLKEELEESRGNMQDMERKYSFLHKQNEEMRKLLSELFSGKLRIDTGSPTHMNTRQKEDSDVLIANEEKRKFLLKKVEEIRRMRKEKEKEMKLEEERKKEREATKKKEMEEAKEQQRLAAERNSRNRQTFSPDLKNGKTTTAKRNGGETYTAKLRTSPRSSPVRGGANIKRSHSALNLSQLRLGDDGEPTPSSDLFSMPAFDRTLKPLTNSPRRRNVNAARQRNFEPKHGSVGPTKTGLKNLGNTCYMNSIIQCLSNTFPLAKYFFQGHYSEDLNPRSNQKGEIAEEIGAVIRAMWCGQYRSIAIWDLKSVVGRYHKAFQGYDQHDSHEFLIKLMDWLHDDLNLVSEKLSKMEEQNFDDIPDYLAAQSVIDSLQERDESVVRDFFHGLHRSVITCHTCYYRSLTFEPFSILTLSFPVSGRCTLKDMLYEYYKETRLEYTCSKCRRVRTCTRKFDIWKLPPVLIIHLSRFEHDVLMKKKQNFVDFPLDNLSMADHLGNPNRFQSYDLYGVSNHYGTIDGGHYTAFCKSPHKSWYKFDDHEVYDLSKDAVRTSAAYILFYEAVHSSKASL